MKALFKRDLLFVVTNQIFLSIGAALIVIVLSKYLNQETFGEIRYVIAILSILSFWSLPGIGMIINHQASVLTRKDLIELVTAQFRWGIGALAVALAIAGFHTFLGQNDLARAFVIGGLFAPIANLYLVPGLVLAGMRKFKQKTVVDTLIILTILGGATLAAIVGESVAGVITIYLGIQTIATFCGLFFILYSLPKLVRNTDDTLYDLSLMEGKQLTFLQIPFSLIPAIEKVLVFLILGPLGLATFVIAVLPIEHFKSAFRNLMQFYMLPHLQRQNVNALLHWFATGALLLTLGIIALILFILYGMPVLFENFESARSFSLLLVLAVLPLPIHIITINWIAKRQIKTLQVYAALAVITSILLMVSFTLLFGLLGAVVAKIIYEILLTAGLLRLDKQYKFPNTLS